MKPIDDAISFGQLDDIAPATLIAHMSDPRMVQHMPLLSHPWDRADADRFVAAKQACWQRDGLGHWAIFHDREYVGWGGFQKEGDDWDYGLVLRPECFGLGMAITRKALDFARCDPRIASVTFLLPPTRTKLAALRRIGAVFERTVNYENEIFSRFRVLTS
ncbi:GNAT family N-acetyltransferase [Thalassospira sp. HF15]|uniref:GNAT family N-acetyltransferase n=1 Tax=Thalassospira sp. HF15 TaxID=2722755 RepID=UPI0014314B79|nr:GNAT family N-acetyltransferase [Thalassospira sp. HF15]NIY75043.1 GNAT family N-acetyltransferase [Thalassospira sp. HF15]